MSSAEAPRPLPPLPLAPSASASRPRLARKPGGSSALSALVAAASGVASARRPASANEGAATGPRDCPAGRAPYRATLLGGASTVVHGALVCAMVVVCRGGGGNESRGARLVTGTVEKEEAHGAADAPRLGAVPGHLWPPPRRRRRASASASTRQEKKIWLIAGMERRR